jgi:uncharacterized protein with PQ loop repeat
LMFIIATISTMLWLMYGILIGSFSMIFTNIIVCSLSIVMLILLFRYKHR